MVFLSLWRWTWRYIDYWQYFKSHLICWKCRNMWKARFSYCNSPKTLATMERRLLLLLVRPYRHVTDYCPTCTHCFTRLIHRGTQSYGQSSMSMYIYDVVWVGVFLILGVRRRQPNSLLNMNFRVVLGVVIPGVVFLRSRRFITTDCKLSCQL